MGLATLNCHAAEAPNAAAHGARARGAQSESLPPSLRIPYPTDVITYHYNVYRQGYTSQETTLTTSNVNMDSFGKIGFYGVDGKVDAQPLYINKQNIAGGLINTLYVVTENDSIYAFSAENGRQLVEGFGAGAGRNAQ